MSLVETERVLVVPTELFHQLGHFQGFTTDVDRYLDGLLKSDQLSYRPRGEMEEDASFKQLIPYVVFQHIDQDGGKRLFQYTRGTGQGEGRLHSKRSIGIGGHISSIDAESNNSVSPYQEGLRRELEEEVAIETTYDEQCVGLINDDESDVGKVHLGIVHLFTVDQPLVQPRETEIVAAGFERVEDLVADLDAFETWSQICLKAIFLPS